MDSIQGNPIVKSLDSSLLRSLARTFSEDLHNNDNIGGILSIIDVLLLSNEQDDTVQVISERVSEHFSHALTKQEDIALLHHLITLLVQLPTATAEVLKWIQDQIIRVIQSRKTLILPQDALDLFEREITQEINPTTEPLEISLDYLLEFLEKLYSFESITVPVTLDKITLILLSLNEEKTTLGATKALRWRQVYKPELQISSWNVIFLLARSSKQSHITAGFILWLRFLTGTSKTSTDSPRLQEVVQLTEYWSFIQTGLTSSIHDHRRYCLSILKLTIQQLQVDFDNELISFHQSDKEAQVDEWKRFATLYEIIGVDTALNQAIAAHADLVQLLRPNSFIKPSWGMALLCTGFKGNMEAVRKYSLELMFSVPKEDLSNFAHPFLTEIFLKYALDGYHFQVKKEGDNFTCSYGDRLELFISSLLRSLKKDPSTLERTVTSLIDLLSEITAVYAPSRIYLASGLLKGLKGKQILTKKHALKIYRLFESTAEDDVFSTTLQTLHIQLLKHIANDVPLLLESLTRFVQYNGYDIFNDHLDTFLDYISAYHDTESHFEYINREPEYQVVHYAMFDEYSITDEFLIELAHSRVSVGSGLSTHYSQLLKRLLDGDYSESYEKTKSLTSLEFFGNSWRVVSVQPLFESVVQDMEIDKFEFFTECFVKVSDITDIPFFQFEELQMLHNVVQRSVTGKNFKIKDTYSGIFLQLLLSFIKMTPLNPVQLSNVLTILEQELQNGNYTAFKYTCQIIQFLLKNYTDVDLITLMEILESIWNHVTGDRLILSQRDMHMTLIETLFDERLLKDTINNEYNGKVLKKIAMEIVSLSQTRRCLLPCLSRKLLQYQRAYTLEFEQTAWLIDVMILSLTLMQEDSNMFKIKHVIAAKYDNELGLDDDIYARVYGPLEVSTRVNVITMLTSCSQEFCEEYFERVLSDEFHFVVPVKQSDGQEELQRVYAFGSLLLISHKISSSTLTSMTLKFMKLLEIEPSPWVRAFMEWIISIDLVKNQENRAAVFALFQDQGKPVLITSAERIAFLVAHKLNGDEALEFFDTFTKYLIPNCASNKPLTRHFSNSLMLSLYPEILSKNLQLPVDGILKMLYEEAEKSAILGKYRTGDAILWDIEDDFNLVGIFGGVLSRISPREVGVITEREFKTCIEGPLSVEIGVTKLATWAGAHDTRNTSNDDPAVSESSPLQTKSGAWESVLDIDENVRSVKRSELIVVSSLVDKPPNLGGICRLCDVLGAGLMTVDDLRVKKHPAFKSVAVTADYWMPIQEVNIGNITIFMREKKKEGYTLIGLEQTDKSIVLGKDTTFPSKSLFLLGKEAEGIPGELLSELDYCVEIRQLGVIRSMNIQTATAVLVHAYSSSLEL